FYPPTTISIYTLSLHDALPICGARRDRWACVLKPSGAAHSLRTRAALDSRLSSESDVESMRLGVGGLPTSGRGDAVAQRPAGVGTQEPLDLRRRHRSAHVVALDLVAAELLQEVHLLGLL